MEWRVRQLTGQLSYRQLVRAGIVPAVLDQLPFSPGKKAKHPPFAYREEFGMNPASFGILVEWTMKKMLSDMAAVGKCRVVQGDDGLDPLLRSCPAAVARIRSDSIGWRECLPDLYEACVSVHGHRGERLNPDTWPASLGYFGKIDSWLKKEWPRTECIYMNEELRYESIRGHPDLVIDALDADGARWKVPLDVKTTGDFFSMQQDSALQVLAYYALLRTKHADARYAGLVLPVQKAIVLWDLDGWDASGFLDVLLETYRRLEMLDLAPKLAKAGTHIPKIDPKQLKGTLQDAPFAVSILAHLQARGPTPFQIFLGSGRAGNTPEPSQADVELCRNILQNYELRGYVHTPYLINLCNPSTKKDSGDGDWAVRLLREQVTQTARLGLLGAVVHTGAAVSLAVDVAVDAMEKHLRSALSAANEDCPILLETPAGEGTDVCASFSQLSAFYDRFSAEEKRKLRICVDSAHVHSAGEDPVDYLCRWLAQHGKRSVGLVHLNDCQGEEGCRKDRHAAPGHGKIGYLRMAALIDLCVQHDIPMVRE